MNGEHARSRGYKKSEWWMEYLISVFILDYNLILYWINYIVQIILKKIYEVMLLAYIMTDSLSV